MDKVLERQTLLKLIHEENIRMENSETKIVVSSTVSNN